MTENSISDDRAFAVTLNNTTWDVLTDGSVDADSPSDVQELFLYGAYASAYHWRVAGGPANWARAEHLVSRAASAIGRSDLALVHARRCLELVDQYADEMTDWDAPFGYEALARAHAGVGDEPAAAEAHAKAVELTAAIDDADDRAVLETELEREPWFGMSFGDA